MKEVHSASSNILSFSNSAMIAACGPRKTPEYIREAEGGTEGFNMSLLFKHLEARKEINELLGLASQQYEDSVHIWL